MDGATIGLLLMASPIAAVAVCFILVGIGDLIERCKEKK